MALDFLAMRSGAEKKLVEYDPPIVPLRYLDLEVLRTADRRLRSWIPSGDEGPGDGASGEGWKTLSRTGGKKSAAGDKVLTMALHEMMGVDLTAIPTLGTGTVLTIASEIGPVFSGATRSRPGALSLGEGLTMIGKLLGHTKVETTARYAHLARESVRESASRVSDSIAADILKGYPGDGRDQAPARTAT